jgi:hypothetical protein
VEERKKEKEGGRKGREEKGRKEDKRKKKRERKKTIVSFLRPSIVSHFH